MNPQNPYEPAPQLPPQPQQALPPTEPAQPVPPTAPGTASPYDAPSLPPQPAQSPHGTHNPYDFIVSTEHKPGGTFPFARSKSSKLLLLVGGMVVLFIVIWLVVSALSPKSNLQTLYIGLAQDQQEITRVAAFGTQASGEDLKALAANTQMSVGTDKTKLLNYLGSKGVKVDTKTLALKQDSNSDTTLTSAKSTNTFDSALANIIANDLKSYMSNLTTAYKQTTGASAKQMLSDDYAHAQLLLKQASTGTTATP